MHLSAPIYKLKRNAKLLAREKSIPLHQALDRVAVIEGFRGWSHLVSRASQPDPAATILAGLHPGDMVLLAARPGHGKTLLGLELAARAGLLGKAGFFFTLDYHERDVANRFRDLEFPQTAASNPVEIDTSDNICADYILRRLARTDGNAIAVIDYMQLLDQKRTNPDLQDQIDALRAFASTKGGIIVLIAQVDRSFDLTGKAMPDLSDVRLPNPLDLSAFDKACFLHHGEIRFEAAA
ncbi:DNA helicase [uncultured Roseovarius sp.]|uniref:DNA helicase n=1 Tax=uncultured Roseovarius sp. TaxID=293344 RepID=UPI002608D77B|nr:DNA helicase [uncultured Roseovarius sp.]